LTSTREIVNQPLSTNREFENLLGMINETKKGLNRQNEVEASMMNRSAGSD
jgi:hypothetical protein